MHHQVHGASPVIVAIEQLAKLVQHPGLGRLVEEVLGPDRACQPRGAWLLSVGDISLGQRDLRGDGVGHRPAEILDDRGTVGLLLDERLLEPGAKHGGLGKLRRVGKKAQDRGGGNLAVAVIDRRPLDGAAFGGVGNAAGELVGGGLVAIGEQLQRLPERDRGGGRQVHGGAVDGAGRHRIDHGGWGRGDDTRPVVGARQHRGERRRDHDACSKNACS